MGVLFYQRQEPAGIDVALPPQLEKHVHPNEGDVAHGRKTWDGKVDAGQLLYTAGERKVREGPRLVSELTQAEIFRGSRFEDKRAKQRGDDGGVELVVIRLRQGEMLEAGKDNACGWEGGMDVGHARVDFQRCDVGGPREAVCHILRPHRLQHKCRHIVCRGMAMA